MYLAELGITLLAVALLQVGEGVGESCTPNFSSNSLYVECGCTAEALEQVKQELHDEIAALKEELHDDIAALKQDLHDEIAALKEELHDDRAALKQDLHDDRTALKQDLHDDIAALKEEVAINFKALQEYLKDDHTCGAQLGETEACAAISCKEIIEKNPCASSGYYWVKARDRCNTTEVFCDFNLTLNGTKGWMKVADLNMNDPTQQCPQEFRLITTPKRLCGKRSGSSCNSVTYSAHGVPYQMVCGRAVGYRHNTPDAFGHRHASVDIDQNYVDGISITYGYPRNHIWTYVAAWGRCPCSTSPGRQPPDFVGSDYYCEAGYRAPGTTGRDDVIYTSHPLWDGKDCREADAPCCQRPDLPWFCKKLPEPTTEDVEVRLCTDRPLYDEDFPVELIELYTQ